MIQQIPSSHSTSILAHNTNMIQQYQHQHQHQHRLRYHQEQHLQGGGQPHHAYTKNSRREDHHYCYDNLLDQDHAGAKVVGVVHSRSVLAPGRPQRAIKSAEDSMTEKEDTGVIAVLDDILEKYLDEEEILVVGTAEDATTYNKKKQTGVVEKEDEDDPLAPIPISRPPTTNHLQFLNKNTTAGVVVGLLSSHDPSERSSTPALQMEGVMTEEEERRFLVAVLLREAAANDPGVVVGGIEDRQVRLTPYSSNLRISTAPPPSALVVLEKPTCAKRSRTSDSDDLRCLVVGPPNPPAALLSSVLFDRTFLPVATTHDAAAAAAAAAGVACNNLEQGDNKKKRRKTSSPTVVESSFIQHHDPMSPRFRSYQADQWILKFEQLQQFAKKNGHSTVPYDESGEIRALARWAKRQRYQFKLRAEGDKESTMTDKRVELLNSLGFIWNSHSTTWEVRLRELANYKTDLGHCNVPSQYAPNQKLATWVKCQRRQYKLLIAERSSNMTPERAAILEQLGFIWGLRKHATK